MPISAMATPTSAATSEGASLIPSPTMATGRRLALQLGGPPRPCRPASSPLRTSSIPGRRPPIGRRPALSPVSMTIRSMPKLAEPVDRLAGLGPDGVFARPRRRRPRRRGRRARRVQPASPSSCDLGLRTRRAGSMPRLARETAGCPRGPSRRPTVASAPRPGWAAKSVASAGSIPSSCRPLGRSAGRPGAPSAARRRAARRSTSLSS